ncbi:MAG: hypothetical protein ABI828_05535 [Actinomycetota bacterium]
MGPDEDEQIPFLNYELVPLRDPLEHVAGIGCEHLALIVWAGELHAGDVGVISGHVGIGFARR